MRSWNEVVQNKVYTGNEAFKNNVNDKQFFSIPYLDNEVVNTFLADETVWVEEKIDGCNVSCEIDTNDKYRCYGMRYELSPEYTCNNSYSKLLDIEDKIRNIIGNKYKIFFEFLYKHHVKYDADKHNKLYVIGLFDKEINKWCTPDIVCDVAKQLNMETPYCFYHGSFISWDNVKQYLGNSMFGAKKGEGIIVKAYSEKYGIKMIKVVTEEFREIMKEPDPAIKQAQLDKQAAKKTKAAEIVTEARIRKQLYNLRDEGIISSVEEMGEQDIDIAVRQIGKLLFADCMKEEPEFVKEFGKEFGKYAAILGREFIMNITNISV